MRLSSLLPDRTWCSQRSRIRAGSRRPTPQRRSSVPWPEVLEDRTVLSPLMVTSGADSGPGSLRDTIAAASSGATIEFAKGIHSITLTSGELDITKSLDIEGLGENQLTIKRSSAKGTPSFRIFDISGTGVDVTITGVKIANGLADGTLDPALNPGLGGGIYHAGGTLSLSHDILAGNQARGAPSVTSFGMPGFGAGGGIANVSGSLEMTDSIFTNNLAQGGADGTGNLAGAGQGGGLIIFAGDVSVTDSRFTGNRAQGGSGNSSNFPPDLSPGRALGAGIDNSATAMAGVLTVIHSAFDHNKAVGGNDSSGFIGGLAAGGGIRNGSGAMAQITSSTFDYNQALGGSMGSGAFFPGSSLGGGFNNQGMATITGSTFDHNLASGGSFDTGSNAGGGSGGGLFNDLPATLALSSSRFIHNRAIGGSRDSGDVSPGLGLGGGLENRGKATIAESTLNHNLAQGGSFNTGCNAGDGSGGGLFNDAPATLALTGSLAAGNHANGGSFNTGSNAGAGSGGGVYNLGTFDPDASVIKKNHASTSNPDIFP